MDHFKAPRDNAILTCENPPATLRRDELPLPGAAAAAPAEFGGSLFISPRRSGVLKGRGFCPSFFFWFFFLFLDCCHHHHHHGCLAITAPPRALAGDDEEEESVAVSICRRRWWRWWWWWWSRRVLHGFADGVSRLNRAIYFWSSGQSRRLLLLVLDLRRARLAP